VARYQKRLSGPLLDRIDVHVEVGRQRDGLPVLEERETSVDVIVEQLGLARDAVRCPGGIVRRALRRWSSNTCAACRKTSNKGYLSQP
jgi:predicted ATPase with chaperone activity